MASSQNLEISVFIKMDRKEKFIGRFDTGIPETQLKTVPQLKQLVANWLSSTNREISDYDDVRLSFALPNEGHKFANDGTVANTHHIVATYDATSGFAPPDDDEESKRFARQLEENDALVHLQLINPYTKKPCGGMHIGEALSLGEVIHNLQVQYYDEAKHNRASRGGGKPPDFMMLLVPFGKPDPHYVPTSHQRHFTEEELAELIASVRKTAFEEFEARMTNSISATLSSSSESEGSPTPQQVTERIARNQQSITPPVQTETPPTSEAGLFIPFRGMGMRLCDDSSSSSSSDEAEVTATGSELTDVNSLDWMADVS